MRVRLAVVSVSTALLLTACGGGDSTSASTSPSDGASTSAGSAGAGADAAGRAPAAAEGPRTLDADVAYENQIADCMKQQGFTYVPHPFVTPPADDPVSVNAGPASLLQPESDVRRWRQKYGFGIAARLVYPDDPQVAVPAQPPDPNKAIVAGLDPAQQAAYNVALVGTESPDGFAGSKAGEKAVAVPPQVTDSCQGKAQQVRDRAVAAQAGDGQDPQKKAAAHQTVVRFENDPAVVAAAKTYASCLQTRGYRLDTTTPGQIENALSMRTDLGGDPAPGAASAAAQQELAQEIRRALDDLDCRAPYAEVVQADYPDILDALNSDSVG